MRLSDGTFVRAGDEVILKGVRSAPRTYGAYLPPAPPPVPRGASAAAASMVGAGMVGPAALSAFGGASGTASDGSLPATRLELARFLDLGLAPLSVSDEARLHAWAKEEEDANVREIHARYAGLIEEHRRGGGVEGDAEERRLDLAETVERLAERGHGMTSRQRRRYSLEREGRLKNPSFAPGKKRPDDDLLMDAITHSFKSSIDSDPLSVPVNTGSLVELEEPPKGCEAARRGALQVYEDGEDGQWLYWINGSLFLRETGSFTMGADFEENWFQFPAEEVEAALAEQRHERRLTAELAAFHTDPEG